MKCQCGANEKIDHTKDCSIVSKAVDKPVVVIFDECSDMPKEAWAKAGELAHSEAMEHFAKKRLLP